MEAKNKSCILGYGNIKSNLNRAIANISASRGLECHIICPREEEEGLGDTNNSRIVKLCGAHFHFCTKDTVAEKVQTVMDECYGRGMSPYYIYGDKYGKGNEEIPLKAYIKVYREIKRQSCEMGIQFDYIFLAVGTGTTQAGLIAGQMINGGNEQIVGISVAREEERQEKILRSMLNVYSHNNDGFTMENAHIEVKDDYVCEGYGKYNEEIKRVIKRMFVTNGIPLDLTYTGKAFWGMLRYVKERGIEGKNILFIHTGGLPLFFDYLDLL